MISWNNDKPLAFASAALRMFEAHVMSQSPREACGFFSGDAEKVHAYWPVDNNQIVHQRFAMDAASIVKTTFSILGSGDELVVIAHSQPCTVRISNEDIHGHRFYRSAYLLIAAIGCIPCSMQLYKPYSEGYRPVSFVIDY